MQGAGEEKKILLFPFHCLVLGIMYPTKTDICAGVGM